MKVLVNCHLPFLLAHGGMQLQIEQTQAALVKIGVEAEFLRWWDDKQTGDVLLHFGWMPSELIHLAHKKGWKVVLDILLTETCNRSERELFTRKLMVRAGLDAPIPRKWKERLQWPAYHLCDKVVVGLEAERRVVEQVYGVPKERIKVIPYGMVDAFLKAGTGSRASEHLISTGTISPVKQSLELAGYAVEAKVPLTFVGKPYDYQSDYWKKFEKLVDGKIVRHVPHVANGAALIELLKEARGYVLMSRFENWCLAAHEAALCGLPLLVPDQPWSRERFGNEVKYFPKPGKGSPAAVLKEFYEQCPKLKAPNAKQWSWVEVAEMFRDLFNEVLAGGKK